MVLGLGGAVGVFGVVVEVLGVVVHSWISATTIMLFVVVLVVLGVVGVIVGVVGSSWVLGLEGILLTAVSSTPVFTEPTMVFAGVNPCLNLLSFNVFLVEEEGTGDIFGS